MRNSLAPFRRSLTRYESVLAYAVLGIVAGLLSGFAVIAFEQVIIQVAALLGVAGHAEQFESLTPTARFLLPAAGALLLGLGFSLLRAEDRETGIVHVISRLHSSYGMLPWRNAVVQFIGGSIALATGQSGGREGPGVHLGAAINSVVGQRLALPNNSLRVLIACGSAGGIAAAFNTPLAGVIFAMEVIVSEYTVAGFMPVMLAAIAASVLSRRLDGGSEVFDMSSVALASLTEIPFVLILGVVCGAAAAMFIRISSSAARYTHWPIVWRFLIAGVVTGALGVAVPEVLGIGYDTLGVTLFSDVTLSALLLIAGAKLFATAIGVGMGMPVGLIGPNLLIGACLGGFLGNLLATLYPALGADPSLYVTVGMAATMGAVFGAPLAACLAVIELTQSTSVAMPALLAIIAANLTNQTVFRQRSAHRSVLRQLQRQLPDDPLNLLLHRTDVNAVLDGSVVLVKEKVGAAVASTLALQVPNWCLVTRDGDNLFLVNGPELLEWLQSAPAVATSPPEEHAELRDVSASSLRRWTLATVPEQATLRQVLDILRSKTVEAVCVYSRDQRGERRLRGVVTRERIERFTLSYINS